MYRYEMLQNYGNQTAGENIADTMGLQAVFRAYKRRERECGNPDPALPELEKFSNDQIFFLSFANVSFSYFLTGFNKGGVYISFL